MGTKNIINIPEGFEVDKEQSTKRQIVLKKIESKRVRSWQEYSEIMSGKDSYYFNEIVGKICSAKFKEDFILSEFVDKEDVEALVAFCKLRKMRKQWIGEWEPDWMNEDQTKFTIISAKNKIDDSISDFINSPMSFPTKEMCNEFIVTFKDLLEIAKSLL